MTDDLWYNSLGISKNTMVKLFSICKSTSGGWCVHCSVFGGRIYGTPSSWSQESMFFIILHFSFKIIDFCFDGTRICIVMHCYENQTMVGCCQWWFTQDTSLKKWQDRHTDRQTGGCKDYSLHRCTACRCVTSWWRLRGKETNAWLKWKTQHQVQFVQTIIQ